VPQDSRQQVDITVFENEISWCAPALPTIYQASGESPSVEFLASRCPQVISAFLAIRQFSIFLVGFFFCELSGSTQITGGSGSPVGASGAKRVASSNLQAAGGCQNGLALPVGFGRQLNVLEPDGPFGGRKKKCPGPAKLSGFRADTRKKDVQRQRWWITSASRGRSSANQRTVAGSVSANFHADLERIEKNFWPVQSNMNASTAATRGSLQAIPV
jgi:hypothetical protein